ncbi:alpha/beta hydrolase [Domibacillus iocasae]|uniref:Esterase n=1 Tax=Domibacillus iocasae TaxID=1714016 RepID=A0A1E7DQ29_9BACI|nr:alpha/beta hydrolase [Domibacillus iocasae]OES45197.1 esterase [Domibacillus iocasae]
MIRLWEKEAPFQIEGEEIPYMMAYPAGTKRAPAMLIFPGGGYRRRADHEGEPVAKWLNSLGIHAFVVHYRVAPYKHPVPLLDASRAIRMIRQQAEKWNVDEKKVGVLGFSAGGHLASTLATKYDHGISSAVDQIEQQSSRPDVVVLGYPVVTFGEHRHEGSMENLLGLGSSGEQRLFLSNERHVTKDTPPAFLWHTAEDEPVPVENSLLFAGALSRAGVPFDLHVFQSGRHGLGLASDHSEAFLWTAVCEKWLRKQGF